MANKSKAVKDEKVVACIVDTRYKVSTEGYVLNAWNKQIGHISSSRRYNKVNIAGKQYLLHRLVWETFHGSIPPDFKVVKIKGSSDALANLKLVSDRSLGEGRMQAYIDGELKPLSGEAHPNTNRKWSKKRKKAFSRLKKLRPSLPSQGTYTYKGQPIIAREFAKTAGVTEPTVRRRCKAGISGYGYQPLIPPSKIKP